MKYIDAEKLIAEIERQQRRLILLSNTEQVDMKRDCALQNGVYDNILSIVTSLQQEQEQHVIGGRVFGATDVEQLYKGKVYIVSNLIQDTEFGIEPREEVKMLLIKD